MSTKKQEQQKLAVEEEATTQDVWLNCLNCKRDYWEIRQNWEKEHYTCPHCGTGALYIVEVRP
jgi:DNA-directed RNA polymerase subunit RPC12/RpoP